MMRTVSLETHSVRQVNQWLHEQNAKLEEENWQITEPQGRHALACGLDQALKLTIDGHAGYYCAGMNKQAEVVIEGSAGVGVAENMMSGTVRVRGNASQCAGATAHGGLLVIEGDAGARCGIAMKGVDIVVGGNVGPMSGFMAQAGRLVVCGNADEALGDSLYEARLYVRGTVESLGADCEEKNMTPEDQTELAELLHAAGYRNTFRTEEFRVYGSARRLYNFQIDQAGPDR